MTSCTNLYHFLNIENSSSIVSSTYVKKMDFSSVQMHIRIYYL